MEIQRLRNLTTGILHTRMQDIYEDIEHLTGSKGVMTHQLGMASKALEPYLRNVATDPRLWDGRHDPSHTGEIEVPPLQGADLAEFWARYDDEVEKWLS
ncbi:conserved hypothetical protein [Pseudomonas sp. OF001]|uniref:DUF7736 domain-containing protein n=1 Tax=Pseudomonas sp. OF001 TaxID=2772300 RepID=UPI0019196602|nr:hypothetical protein [Pseudomonas sp. OF001]CAD5377321.1 conserved hypothetical protein [Pseudomonas sp. OF001]